MGGEKETQSALTADAHDGVVGGLGRRAEARVVLHRLKADVGPC